MPGGVTAELELDLSAALAKVDDLGSALAAALDNAVVEFQDQITTALAVDQTVTVTADASTVTPTVDEAVQAVDAVLPVGADTSAAEAAVSALVGEVDATDASISVDADTSGADAPIADLGATAKSAAGDAGGLQSGLEGVGAASLALKGQAGGAAEGIGKMANVSAPALGAVAALAGGVGFLAQNALDDASATERFNLVLGKFRDQVENVKVGNLNIDLTQLAIKVGSTDDALQGATAQAFQFATTSGKSGTAAAQYASNLAAISARAVALKPDLGDVGAVTTQLQSALASGRERALIPFALGMTKVQIEAHAAELGLQDVDGTVSKANLAFAGADLAAKKFGSTLSQDIEKGSKNVAIQQRSVKAALEETLATISKPLIVPFLDVMRAGTPLVEQIGRLFTTLGTAALPLVTNALSTFVPILQVVADVLAALPPELLQGVIMGNVLGRAFDNLGPKAGSVGFAIGALLPLLNDIAPGAGKAVTSVLSLTAAGAAIGGPWGAAAGAILGVTQQLISGGESVEDYRKKFAALSSEIDKASQKKALQTFIDTLGFDDKIKLFSGNIRGVKDELEALGAKSPAAAAKVAEGLKTMFDAGTKSGAKAIADIDATVAKIQGNYAKAATTAATATAANSSLAASFDLVALSTGIAAEATKGHVTIQQGAITAGAALAFTTGQSSAQVAGAALAYSEASFAASNYKTTLDILNAGTLTLAGAEQAQLSAQQSLTQAIKDTKGNLDLSTDAGVKNYGQLIQTTQAVQAHGVALVNAGGSQAEATANLNAYTAGLITMLQNAGQAPEAIAGIVTKLGLVPNVTDEATRTLLGFATTTSTDVPASATTGVDGYTTAISGLAAGTVTATQASSAVVSAWDISQKMAAQGSSAGKSFGDAVAAAIKATTGENEDAARALVRAIHKAADNAGSPSVHLFEDSGVSFAEAISRGMASVEMPAQEIVKTIVRESVPMVAAVPALDVAGGSAAPAGGGDVAGMLQQLVGALTPATAGGGGSQIGPFYLSGSDPQETASLVAREVQFQQRYAGV